MKVKRILHVTALRELGSGQRNQLKYEVNAAKEIQDINWNTIAFHSGEKIESFESRTPKYIDVLVFRNIYFWLKVIRMSKHYDIVMFRYLPFDIFSIIFSPFVKNRVSVHHSKEIEELVLIKKGWKGIFASIIERFTGKISINNSLLIAGVTEEIAKYQNERRKLNKKYVTYQNGIKLSDICIADDNRLDNEINIIFVCSYFTEWHGLDILLDFLNTNDIDDNFFVHLIGNLNTDQLLIIENNKYKNNINVYGALNKNEIYSIASKCDTALGSLALFRQNMTEGSTLKVSEMLAMGIPVYSGHKDASLPEDFPYYTFKKDFNFFELLNFSKKHKVISRLEVREASSVYIEKSNIMKNFIRTLNCIIED
ncbi:glycosyltransferase [Acinetobacter sp. YH01010]|uniref:glycosyltransferase n=1 Tax=Acinetobacter sp. YH01010 TaxID=2601026 RepID=UPI0015D25FA2|nr:glycosyltransferase [Acinetobacter sp. YH01010]